jgi:hypothetical protein
MALHRCQDPERTTSGGKHKFSHRRRLWHGLARGAGKRGRAVGVSTLATAQVHDVQEKQIEIAEPTFSTVPNVNATPSESHIVDLYAVGAKTKEGEKTTSPFIHQIQLQGPQGEVVRVWATFDEGALMEAMSTQTFEKVKHRLSTLQPSPLLL